MEEMLPVEGMDLEFEDGYGFRIDYINVKLPNGEIVLSEKEERLQISSDPQHLRDAMVHLDKLAEEWIRNGWSVTRSPDIKKIANEERERRANEG